MKTTSEYIDLIKAHSDELRTQFGVRTLRLFGSVSRGEQHEGSDVNVCVENPGFSQKNPGFSRNPGTPGQVSRSLVSLLTPADSF